MKTIILYRRNFEHGAFGVLCDEFGQEICKTIERPWLHNAANISCVPTGVYNMTPRKSPRHGDCYALENRDLGVTIFGPSQRTHILFHVANRVDQLQGCIGVGMQFGVLKDKDDINRWAVLDSKIAFEQLMKHLAGEPARLIIKKA